MEETHKVPGLVLSDFSADAGVVRNLDRIPACRGSRLCQERLGDAPARPIVHHRETGAVTGIFLILEFEFDWHASPIIGNFYFLGVAQSAIHYDSAIKMHKCIFEILTFQVIVFRQITLGIVHEVAQ